MTIRIHSVHPVELTPTQNHYPQMKFYLEVFGGITIIITTSHIHLKAAIIGRYNYYLPQIKQNIDTKLCVSNEINRHKSAYLEWERHKIMTNSHPWVNPKNLTEFFFDSFNAIYQDINAYIAQCFFFFNHMGMMCPVFLYEGFEKKKKKNVSGKEKAYTVKCRWIHREFYKWVIIFIVLKYFIIIASSLKDRYIMLCPWAK